MTLVTSVRVWICLDSCFCCVLIPLFINLPKQMVLTGEPKSSSSENDEPILGPQRTHYTRRQQQAQTNRGSTGNSNNAADENPEILMKMLLEAAKRLWQQIKSTSNFVMVDLGGYHLFDRLAHWGVQHPQIAICLLAAGIVTFLPFLLLVGFGLSTILMTFTGFLVLEGTLLTILSMMLFGLFGALLIVLLFFAVLTVATYFGFARIYDLYGNKESHKSALRSFLQRENLHGGNAMEGGTNCIENSRDETVN